MKVVHKNLMINKFRMDFNADITKGHTHYLKDNSEHVVMYKWEDKLVYRAPFKCLSSSTDSLEAACLQVEAKCNTKAKHEEYYLFTEHIEVPIVDGIEVRELTLEDEALLVEMKEACDREEVELVAINIYDYHVLGAFKDGKLVGASSLLDLWGAYDIGVIVHPQYRKQKVSSCIVAHNASWILSQGKVCMYRCDADNMGSYKTALGLGFKKEVDITIYKLKEEVKR